MLQDAGPGQTPEVSSSLLIPLPAATERDLEEEISDMAMQGGAGGRREEYRGPDGRREDNRGHDGRREDSGGDGAATEAIQQPEASGSGVQFRKPVKKDLRNIRKRSHEED